jgi:hypothetical protein
LLRRRRVEKTHELGHRLLRRLFHQPVARTFDDDALHVRCNQAALPDQEFAGGLLASQYQHRHRQRLLRKFREILRVLIEGAEVFEACLHTARLGVLGRIEAAIGFR